MRTLFLLLLILAPSAYALDGDEVLSRIEGNMWPESYEMQRTLNTTNRDGSERVYLMFTLKKGRDKVVNLFLEPAEEQGRVLLRVGGSMWLKLQDVERPLRVSSVHSVVSGLFNNWDLMMSNFSSDYAVLNAKEEEDAYVLTLKAKNDWVIYDTLEMRAGKQDFLLRKVEAFTTAGMLLKTVTFRNIKDFGDGIVRPSVVETASPLWPRVKIVMSFGEIRKRELSDDVFTVDHMSKIDAMRP